MTCPSWCTIHADPEWVGSHYSTPVHVVLVVRTPDGDPAPVEVVVAVTGTEDDPWVEIHPADVGGPVVTVDAGSARRLRDALVRLT